MTDQATEQSLAYRTQYALLLEQALERAISDSVEAARIIVRSRDDAREIYRRPEQEAPATGNTPPRKPNQHMSWLVDRTPDGRFRVRELGDALDGPTSSCPTIEDCADDLCSRLRRQWPGGA